MIEARRLAKQFGTVAVLEDVSFQVPNGRITTLLGGNGTGKTTILRTLTGLLRPTSGVVHVDGVDVWSTGRAARRRMGVVSDHFGLYPYLTAREHLRLAGALRGLRGDALETATTQAEEALGIAPFARTHGRHLSQGQAMRVAVARAIVGDPENIVMDEPTRGLDVFGVRLLRQLLFALRDQGKAVLLTNHALAEIEDLSDQLLVLARGCIVANGSITELLAASGKSTLEACVMSLAQQEDVR